MHRLLALLLNAAVEGPQRERFISRIEAMSADVQEELVAEIRKVRKGRKTFVLGGGGGESQFMRMSNHILKAGSRRRRSADIAYSWAAGTSSRYYLFTHFWPSRLRNTCLV